MLSKIEDMPPGTLGFMAVGEDRLRAAVAAFSFLRPGRAKAFRIAELDAAKQWLVGEPELAGETATQEVDA